MMVLLLTFVEGLASFLSPCTLPMVPVYVAYFAAEDRSRISTFARAMAFVVAFTAVFVSMGAFAGSLGRLLAAYRSEVRLICGTLMVVLGAGYLGLFKLPFHGIRKARPVTGLLSAFIFGIVFALGLTPCVGAFLASALLQAAAEGTTLKGALLLAAYSLGLGLPLVMSALVLSQLKNVFAAIKAHYRWLNLACGLMLVAAGVLLATGGLRPGRTVASVADQLTETKKMEITLTNDNFETEVLKSDRPVIVDFWATWCGPCRMLGPVLAEIAEEKRDVLKVGKVNVDECPELAARYGIMSIPAVFLFRDGKVVAQAVGYMPKDELLATLGKIEDGR